MAIEISFKPSSKSTFNFEAYVGNIIYELAIQGGHSEEGHSEGPVQESFIFLSRHIIDDQGQDLSAVGAESHYLPFSAHFRTIFHSPHISALLAVFRTFSHNSGLSTLFFLFFLHNSEISSTRFLVYHVLESIGTRTWEVLVYTMQTWEVLALTPGKYWYSDLGSIDIHYVDLGSIGTRTCEVLVLRPGK